MNRESNNFNPPKDFKGLDSTGISAQIYVDYLF